MKMTVGKLLTFEQVWELSKLWYRDRLSPEFKGRTIEEAHQIFEQLGLRTQFWRFDVPSGQR
jgi:hypothetical protein